MICVHIRHLGRPRPVPGCRRKMPLPSLPGRIHPSLIGRRSRRGRLIDTDCEILSARTERTRGNDVETRNAAFMHGRRTLSDDRALSGRHTRRATITDVKMADRLPSVTVSIDESTQGPLKGRRQHRMIHGQVDVRTFHTTHSRVRDVTDCTSVLAFSQPLDLRRHITVICWSGVRGKINGTAQLLCSLM